MTTEPTEQETLGLEEFRAYLHAAAVLNRTIERYEAGRDGYVAKIIARYERLWLKSLRERYAAAIKPVLTYIRDHHKELFADAATVDEIDALLKRTPSSQLLFDEADEKNIVAHLEQAGRGDLVNVVKTLNKEPIKKDPEVVKTTVGLRIGEFINIQLTFKPLQASGAKPKKKPKTENVQIAVN